MRAGLRGIGRTIGVIVFLSGWMLVHAVTRPFHRGPARERWRRRVLGGGCRRVLHLLGVRVVTEGGPPEETGVLVTNHLGYLDVLVLGSLMPVVFVSRADVKGWPLVGPLAVASGTLFLERERKRELPAVVDAMRGWVERGVRVIFFPEGTSGRGDVVMPFRSSLFEVAVRAGVTVHAAALDYRTADDDPPADEAVCWWGDTPFLPHAWKLVRTRAVVARVSFADVALRESDRKTLARRAQEAVESRFRASVDDPVESAGA